MGHEGSRPCARGGQAQRESDVYDHIKDFNRIRFCCLRSVVLRGVFSKTCFKKFFLFLRFRFKDVLILRFRFVIHTVRGQARRGRHGRSGLQLDQQPFPHLVQLRIGITHAPKRIRGREARGEY